MIDPGQLAPSGNLGGTSLAAYTVFRDYAPAAVGVGETTGIFRTKTGLRVTGCSVLILTAAAGGSTATFDVGDSGSANGYLAALSCATAKDTLTDGKGTYVTQNGKLYLAVDNVSVKYTPGAGPGATNPRCRVCLEVVQVWPTVK